VTDYYVDAGSGDDANTGLIGDPWATLGKMTSEVVAATIVNGDIVYVKGGTAYTETMNTGSWPFTTTPGESIQIIGYTTTISDGGMFTIDGESTRTNGLITLVNDRRIIFRNMRVTGHTGTGCSYGQADALVFHNCRFDNNGSHGALNDDYCHYFNCQSDGNSGDGFNTGFGTTFTGVLSFGNTSEQITMTSGRVLFAELYGLGGTTNRAISMTGTGSNENSIMHVIADGENSASKTGFYIGNTTRFACPVWNCSLYDFVEGIDFNSSCKQEGIVRYCHFHSNSTADITNATGDLFSASGAPLFTDEANSDYSLGASSPLIDAGFDAGALDGGTSYMDIGGKQKEAAAGGAIVNQGVQAIESGIMA